MLLAFGGRDDRDLDATLGRILAMRVDGIICEGVSAEALHGRSDVHCPVVLLDDPNTMAPGSRVGFDLASAADQVAAHLTELGHRRIAYITAATDAPTFRVRQEGVKDRLRIRAGKTARMTVAVSETTTEAADAAVMERWASWARASVTAIVCATDVQAYGALLALERLGVPVPEECSVIGFDNLSFSALTRPSLTSVSLPSRELGKKAAQMLMKLIDKRSVPAAAVTLPVQLVIRDSSGVAARASRSRSSGTNRSRAE